ncbi:uncharacterized protein G2W53_025392 [Senna tora]|uniref:Uncharacterized protein n=1 Tax=Senna tora TaxID=362788 RepID=A0A834WEQ6_9FABA|nr:uncharacterized protein G2W53_025392 [Senna tora]
MCSCPLAGWDPRCIIVVPTRDDSLTWQYLLTPAYDGKENP